MILQEDYELLLTKGASITGVAKDVDDFVQTMKVLNVQQLGPIKSAMVGFCGTTRGECGLYDPEYTNP